MIRVIISLVFVLLLALTTNSEAAREHTEKWYQDNFCKTSMYIHKEYRLRDNTRVDCLTEEYAFELDFADKWAEAVGQSLHYAYMTNRKPGVVLIVEKYSDLKYIERLSNAFNYAKIDVKLIVIHKGMYK